MVSKNQIRTANKSILFIFIIIIVLVSSWHFRPSLYLNDRYSWYIYMAEKKLNFDEKGAFSYIEKAIELDAERTEAYKQIIITYRFLGMADKAEKELASSKRLNGSLFYYINLGEIALEKGKLNESIHFFKEGMEKFPDSPGNSIGIGFVYLKMNDTENAIRYFNESSLLLERYKIIPIGRQRLSARLHAGLGFAYQQRGELEKADKELEIAESIQKGSTTSPSLFLIR